MAAFLDRGASAATVPRPKGGGMSAEQGSSKVLTLAESEKAPHALDALGPIDEGPTLAAAPVPELPDTAALDTRTLSRSLFLRLAALDEDSPERGYVRDT